MWSRLQIVMDHLAAVPMQTAVPQTFVRRLTVLTFVHAEAAASGALDNPSKNCRYRARSSRSHLISMHKTPSTGQMDHVHHPVRHHLPGSGVVQSKPSPSDG